MNQIKIGKFISENRKKVNLTQFELAEKLCVTDRAVSKWENGKSMPDSSIMLELCEILQISVTELSSIACLSKKQFEREFQSHVGMNPREYTRIVRFQKALAQMQYQPNGINQAQIAYASGYADQSHLIREFKRLCGYTPMSLLKISTPYSDLFTNPI